MKKYLLFISIAIVFASCSSKQPKFELEVVIKNNASLLNKKLVVTEMLDASILYTDTFKIKKDQFLLEIPYHGKALLFISILQSNVDEIMMVAEEGKVELNIDGTKTSVGGTLLNDRMQAFKNQGDSVAQLFKQIDKEYEILYNDPKSTPKMKEELRERRTQALTENTDRIVAFIKENVDNPVGEYYFRNNYVRYTYQRKMELSSFATDKLKKEFGIK